MRSVLLWLYAGEICICVIVELFGGALATRTTCDMVIVQKST